MEPFTVYDPATGAILRSGYGPDGCSALQAGPGEAVLAGQRGDSTTHYIDTPVGRASGVSIEHPVMRLKPERPSPWHTWNAAARAWEDARSLADFKALQWALIKARRDDLLAEPLLTPWGVVDAGPAARAAIARLAMTAALRAGLEPTAPGNAVQFTLADNTTAALSPTDIGELALQVDAHEQCVRALANQLRERIDAATSVPEVESITWPAAASPLPDQPTE